MLVRLNLRPATTSKPATGGSARLSMFLVLGAASYIGQAFATELRRRGQCFIPLSRRAFDYTRFELLFEYVRKIRPTFVINAAVSHDASSAQGIREEVFQTNAVLPQMIGRVCELTNTPWGHVSSARIFSGARVLDNGAPRLERDLNDPRLQRLFEVNPEAFLGFSESDEPNRSFRCPPCSFWEGTKALAEEALRGKDRTFIWRAGLPFNEDAMASNLLVELQHSAPVSDTLTCLSQVDEFARACLDLHERHAPFGVYNVVNPGAIRISKVAALIQQFLRPPPNPRILRLPRSANGETAEGNPPGCILDSSKLSRAGLGLRPVMQAVEAALEKWHPQSRGRRTVPRLRALS